jgi:predicted membrane-bound spermidine synthase
MLRLRDVLSGKDLQLGKTTFNLKAVAILLEILAITILLAFLFIILPLFFKARRSDFRGSLSLLLYFMSIGLGFIIIEVSFLQRLIIYLGHPIYSLSVILFSFLLGGGIGSYLSQKIIKKEKWTTNHYLVLIPIMTLVLIGGIIIPYVIAVSGTIALPIRIIFSLLTIGLMGISMGVCFPLGVSYASQRHKPLLPFLWGVNGALSVVASVLSVVIAITSGISMAFWVGILCYIVAFISLLVFSRKFQV